MIVKKSGKNIFGADLTNVEQKALNIEINRQIAENTRKHELEIEAVVIRQLRRLTGWGERRLKRFYDEFDIEIDKLLKAYEMGDEDAPWLCTRELKEEGIDIHEWYNEKQGH